MPESRALICKIEGGERVSCPAATVDAELPRPPKLSRYPGGTDVVNLDNKINTIIFNKLPQSRGEGEGGTRLSPEGTF